jgi:hypothetical protein
MRVNLPHKLPRDEVRRRLRSRSHEIGSLLPGSTVSSDWPHEDHMRLTVQAMGQQVTGDVEIGEGEVVLEFDVPPALSFLTPMLEKAARAQGEKLLLAPPKD